MVSADENKTVGDKSLNEWRDYQNLVLHELSRLNKNIEEVCKLQVSQSLEINTLKVKATIFGSLAGFFAGLGVIIVEYLLDKARFH